MKEYFSEFWVGLLFILSYLWKFVVIVVIIFLIIAILNVILKKINASWSLKFSKSINKMISNADGLKRLTKSFERLINGLFNALSGIINLLTILLAVTFDFFDKGLGFIIEKIDKFTNKIGGENNSNKEEKSIEKNDEVAEEESKETLLEKQLREKSEGSTNE